MPGTVVCVPPGNKLGNSALSWLHAYAHAQRVGAQFRCPEWIGEKVFHLPPYERPEIGPEYPIRSEIDLKADETNVCIRGYAQNQSAIIYTRKQARVWLIPRFTLAEVLGDRQDLIFVTQKRHNIAHRRVGDYVGYGYPIVSAQSIQDGIKNYGFDPEWFYTCTEEHPTPAGKAVGDMTFLPDFYRMVYATVLFRGNSSFSWLAGLLSTGAIFSPVVKGLKGGMEHDVEYVPGNWPALSDLACGSDMHVRDA